MFLPALFFFSEVHARSIFWRDGAGFCGFGRCDIVLQGYFLKAFNNDHVVDRLLARTGQGDGLFNRFLV